MRGSRVSQHPGGGSSVTSFWRACLMQKILWLWGEHKRSREFIAKPSSFIHWAAQPNFPD